MGTLCVGVLVEEVTRMIPNELDAYVKLILAAYAVAQRRHLRAVINSLNHAEAGDGRSHWILAEAEGADRHSAHGTASTRVGAW